MTKFFSVGLIEVQMITKLIFTFLVDNYGNLQFELSAIFGLQMLNPWNIFEGSVELLTSAPAVVVTTFVVAVFPANIDDSALAFAKLNPIELGDFEDGVDAEDGDVSAATNVGAAADGVTADVCTVVGVAGFTDGELAFEAPRENEKFPIELVFVIGTEVDTGLFSLSLLDLSLAAEKALPRSNLNGLGVAAVVGATVGVLNRAGFCAGTFCGGAVVEGAILFATGVIGLAAIFAPDAAIGLSSIGFSLAEVGVTNKAGFAPTGAIVAAGFDRFITSGFD